MEEALIQPNGGTRSTRPTLATPTARWSSPAIIPRCSMHVEILKAAAGSRLIGLLPHRRPHAEQVFQALLADDGLSKAQVEILNGLYILEGRLEHASPDVDAEEVRDAIVQLREALPELVESARAWLERHGVELQ